MLETKKSKLQCILKWFDNISHVKKFDNAQRLVINCHTYVYFKSKLFISRSGIDNKHFFVLVWLHMTKHVIHFQLR